MISGDRSMYVVDSKAVERMLKIAPVKVKKHLNSMLDKSTIEVRANIMREAPKGVTGLLKQSRVTRKNLERVIGSRANYSKYVELGTRPHWTSVENLRSWADLKGINPYAVQKSIAMKGTKANPYITRAYDRSLSKIGRIAREGLKDMVEDIVRTG